MTPYTV